MAASCSQSLQDLTRLKPKKLKDKYDGYEKCRTIDEKIRFFLDNNNFRLTTCEEVEYKKCPKAALELRKVGNKYYASRAYQKALEIYTKAILHSPIDGNDCLALSYANRSATFYDMGKYDICLMDANRALESGYPNHLRYKIYMRQCRCHRKLGNPDKFEVCCSAALRSVDKSRLTGEHKDELKEELNKLLDEMAKSAMDSDKRSNKSTLPELYCGENDRLRNASSALRLECDEISGRHIVSKQDVPSGSVLFVEKPFASLLLPGYYSTHCFCCCRRTEALMPCPECSQIGYCSAECQIESWNSCHKFECCKLTQLNEIGIMHLALRVLLSAKLEKILSWKVKIPEGNSTDQILGTDSNGSYTGDYYSVYFLENHEEKLTDDEITNHILYSCYVVWFLQDSFARLWDANSYKSILLGPSKYFITYLLFRHSLQLICNAHAITGMSDDEPSCEDGISTFDQVRIGVAIYPTASLMNHSCKPNILSSFVGNCLIVRATEDIPKEGEVLNCYGPHYLRMPKTDRQKNLEQQYKFVCHCSACDSEGFSHFDGLKCKFCDGNLTASVETISPEDSKGSLNLDKLSPLVSTKSTKSAHNLKTVIESKFCNINGFCTECKRSQDCVEKIKMCADSERIFSCAWTLMKTKKYKEAIEELLEVLRLRESCLYRNNKKLGSVYDLLAKCYCHEADFESAIKYLRLSLGFVEKCYGIDSIEYGMEMIKLTDIQVKHIVGTPPEKMGQNFKVRLRELLDTCDIGIRLLRTALGEVHPYVEDLMEKKQHFSQFL